MAQSSGLGPKLRQLHQLYPLLVGHGVASRENKHISWEKITWFLYNSLHVLVFFQRENMTYVEESLANLANNLDISSSCIAHGPASFARSSSIKSPPRRQHRHTQTWNNIKPYRNLTVHGRFICFSSFRLQIRHASHEKTAKRNVDGRPVGLWWMHLDFNVIVQHLLEAARGHDQSPTEPVSSERLWEQILRSVVNW